MPTIADIIQESTSTVGTGDLTLTGARPGFLSFASKIAVGSTVPYVLVEGNSREVGVGTMSTSTTLQRTTIEASTNAGAAIALTGTAIVCIGPTASSLHRLHTKSAEVGIGLQPAQTFHEHRFSPATAPDQTIKFGRLCKFIYDTPQDNSGAGHCGPSISWFLLPAGSGDPNYGLAHEAKFETEAGTFCSIGSCYEGQITGAGEVTVWNGVQGRVTAHSGTIDFARGHYAQANTSGTIGEWVGFYNDAKAGAGSLGANYAFKNDDTQGVVYSAGPICDATLQYETPTSGATITVADKITSVLINPAGTLAALTLTFPANPINGQPLSFSTVQALTAITINGNGKTVLQQVSSLPASGTVVFKYYAPASVWYRWAG